jgi:hypothetical protein
VARSSSPPSGFFLGYGRPTRSTSRCRRPSCRAPTRRPARPTSPSKRRSTLMRPSRPARLTSRRRTSRTSPRSPRGGSSGRCCATGSGHQRASSPTSSAWSKAMSSSQPRPRSRRRASPRGRRSRSRVLQKPSLRATGPASRSLTSSGSAAHVSGACRLTFIGSRRRAVGRRQTQSRRRIAECLDVVFASPARPRSLEEQEEHLPAVQRVTAEARPRRRWVAANCDGSRDRRPNLLTLESSISSTAHSVQPGQTSAGRHKIQTPSGEKGVGAFRARPPGRGKGARERGRARREKARARLCDPSRRPFFPFAPSILVERQHRTSFLCSAIPFSVPRRSGRLFFLTDVPFARPPPSPRPTRALGPPACRPHGVHQELPGSRPPVRPSCILIYLRSPRRLTLSVSSPHLPLFAPVDWLRRRTSSLRGEEPDAKQHLSPQPDGFRSRTATSDSLTTSPGRPVKRKGEDGPDGR